MYSPAVGPCSVRAAPAKKRRLSAHERDLVGAHRGDRLAGVVGLDLGQLLGVLLDRVGELQQRQRALARRWWCDHSSKAVSAASTARLTSSTLESGAWAIVSPVAGLRIGSVSPVLPATYSLAIRFWTVGAVAVIAGTLPLLLLPDWRSVRRVVRPGGGRQNRLELAGGAGVECACSLVLGEADRRDPGR